MTKEEQLITLSRHIELDIYTKSYHKSLSVSHTNTQKGSIAESKLVNYL